MITGRVQKITRCPGRNCEQKRQKEVEWTTHCKLCTVLEAGLCQDKKLVKRVYLSCHVPRHLLLQLFFKQFFQPVPWLNYSHGTLTSPVWPSKHAVAWWAGNHTHPGLSLDPVSKPEHQMLMPSTPCKVSGIYTNFQVSPLPSMFLTKE